MTSRNLSLPIYSPHTFSLRSILLFTIRSLSLSLLTQLPHALNEQGANDTGISLSASVWKIAFLSQSSDTPQSRNFLCTIQRMNKSQERGHPHAVSSLQHTG